MFIRSSIFAAVATFALASAVARASTPLDVGTIDGVRDLGPAPASTSVRVAVVLRYRHEEELERLIEAQADPGSRLYHHFLVPSAFRNYFAPTSVQYEQVTAALRRGGFTISHAFPNRTVVDAIAPAPVAARFFATDIHRVISPEVHGVTYTNVRAAAVPSALDGLVLTVVGLDAATRLQPAYIRGASIRPRPFRGDVRRNANPVFGPDGGYGPPVFVNAYDLPAANGFDGRGRASGVATDNDFLDTDLTAYLAYFNVQRTGPATTRVLVDGGPPPGLGNDSVETTLDVETIVSISPGTALYVYEAPYDEPTNSNFVDIYNTVVNDNKVDTLNSSYIYCETRMRHLFRGYPHAVDAIEKQGAAEGITFHAAAGDSGSSSPGCLRRVSVGVSSSTPHNIAIGGTTLGVNANGIETSEVGWDATGGGVSKIFPLPSYQQGVPNVIATGRNLPDLAFDADPGSGESLYFDGAFDGPIGGTSLASPIFGAALTQLDQVENSRAGYFNVTLYKTWLANGYGSGSTAYFRDITQGSIPPFNAGPGYDQMSGIGAMQVTNFAALLHS